jgi:predicted ATP-grasp superfamily ATP-dependent carboligase
MIEKILDWTDQHNISMFLGLEGLKSTKKKEDEVDVYGIGSNSDMVDVLNSFNIEKIKEGMIAGFTGAFLSAQTERNKDMICMLTEAHLAFPDSRAAGRLLEKVDEMLPGVNLNLEPLYDEAEKIENNLKEYMKQSQQMPRAKKSDVPNMYH